MEQEGETILLGRGYCQGPWGSEDNCMDPSYITTKFKITILVQISAGINSE